MFAARFEGWGFSLLLVFPSDRLVMSKIVDEDTKCRLRTFIYRVLDHWYRYVIYPLFALPKTCCSYLSRSLYPLRANFAGHLCNLQWSFNISFDPSVTSRNCYMYSRNLFFRVQFQRKHSFNRISIMRWHYFLNPSPPRDAVRRRGKKLEDLFSSVLSQFKKYHPSENLKLNNLDIFQILKLRSLVPKSFQLLLNEISLQILWAVMGESSIHCKIRFGRLVKFCCTLFQEPTWPSGAGCGLESSPLGVSRASLPKQIQAFSIRRSASGAAVFERADFTSKKS